MKKLVTMCDSKRCGCAGADKNMHSIKLHVNNAEIEIDLCNKCYTEFINSIKEEALTNVSETKHIDDVSETTEKTVRLQDKSSKASINKIIAEYGEDKFIYEYIDNNRSAKSLAEELGVPVTCIQSYIHRNNISKRSKNSNNKDTNRIIENDDGESD